MTVGYAEIREAELILGRIAFSRGEDVDPAATLADWRASEGIAELAVEQAARESADGSAAEIQTLIEDGEPFDLDLARQFLEREYQAAWQVGWIAAKRDSRPGADEQRPPNP